MWPDTHCDLSLWGTAMGGPSLPEVVPGTHACHQGLMGEGGIHGWLPCGMLCISGEPGALSDEQGLRQLSVSPDCLGTTSAPSAPIPCSLAEQGPVPALNAKA